ncbi:MAG: hypothetical protein ABSH32_12885 [Bryobacteraceae bacterium]|jgi:hypothetical protein
MLDTLRRLIGGEVRPVDLWLTIIEILVLLLVALEVAWAMKDRLVAWRKLRVYRQGIMARLDSLSQIEANALRLLVLHSRQPPDAAMSPQMTALLERSFVGWKVRERYVDVLEEWAKKQPPTPPIAI